MMPRVSAYTIGRPVSELSGNSNIVPIDCVRKGPQGKYVLQLLPSGFDGVTPQAVAVDVNVEKTSNGFCAISGAVQQKDRLICHSSKFVASGNLVKIVGEAFDEKDMD